MQSIKGFTMVELIMVVVIIGMMALFAIPNYNNSVKKTYVKTAKNNLMIIYSAQRIKKISGANYQGAAAVANINTNLDLSVLANGLNYSCTTTGGGTPTGFYCYAEKTGTDGFKVKKDETNAEPCCCTANACPGITTTCASCP